MKNFASLPGPLLLPGWQLGTLSDDDLVELAEIQREFVGIRIPCAGIAFEGPVYYFLQLG